MPKRGLLLVVLIFMLLFGTWTSVSAKSTAKFSISAEILSPIQLSLINGLDFGKVFKGSTALTVSPVMPTPGTLPASFEVTGEPGTEFLLSLPASATISNGQTSLEVTGFSSDLLGEIGNLGSAGFSTFNVGATLASIPNTATSGIYTGTAVVTVVYSF